MSFSQPLLSQVFRDMHRAFSLLDEPLTNVSRRALTGRYPPTDIIETTTGYELHAEIPGFKKQDIELQLPDDHTLVIGGKQETVSTDRRIGTEGEATPTEETDETAVSTRNQATDVVASQGSPYWWKSERVTGSFSRSFTFPHSINGDAIKASYKDGILIVTIPKSDKSTIRIPIE
ncbi:HSP20-like chaperone [Halteromyces radiatus]|uniref:HSP20-like chaperone n=1 Tax=Halteromyces radiatus TaxID=101107 RepID=UPI00221FDDA6|nr:HSP20-like chaperone [Halteromyces radiatus]KAI8086279.1 HSP20-like chaperone [Halteromyces radiatus]